MFISRLQIKGFRGLRDLTLPLTCETVLIGANNVGKTAVVDALSLLLGRGRLFRQLGEHDFFGSNPAPETRITIRGVITGFESQDPSDYPSLFNLDRATPAWWNADTGQLSHEEPSGRTVLALELGFAARLDHDTLEVETRRYFVDSDVDPFLDDLLPKVPARFVRSFGLFVVPASRTWDRILTFRHELFRRALREQDALPAETIPKLRDWLRDPPHHIEADPRLSGVVERVNAELGGYLGIDEADVRFRATTGDLTGLFEAVHAYLPDKAGGYLPLARHGSGVRSLQTLLLLLELGRYRKKQGDNFVLVVEEPELHLHPGHHRRLVSRVRGVSDQTVTTTHSPLVASYHTAADIVVLRVEGENVNATPLIPAGGEIPNRNALLRLFTLYRVEVSQALMSSEVILPEGLTEFRWFQALTQSCITAEGWNTEFVGSTPDTVGVLPTQNAHVVTTFAHFSQLIPHLIPVVDGDAAGSSYVDSLLELDTPPVVVAQLQDGWALEELIGWVLCGEDEFAPDGIVPIFQLDAAPERGDFIQLLHDNKTRWDRHEQLIVLIGVIEGAVGRVRRIIQGLAELARLGETGVEGWQTQQAPDGTPTPIWRFIASRPGA